MSNVVYYGTLADITGVVQTFPANSETFTILEKLPTRWLTLEDQQDGLIFEAFAEDKDFSAWERGRIFNQAAELRWETTDGQFQVVYIGPQLEESGLTLDADLDLTQAVAKESHYYLWGQRMSADQLRDMNWDNQDATDIFVELKTPRVLCYPAPAAVGGRLKLGTVEYFDKQSGQRLLYRLKGVEAA